MSRFAIGSPYFIVVMCLIVCMLGAVSVARMPVDLFPAMNFPVVVVATLYSGMPPEQIEGNITFHLERFFMLASGIDHIESRSLNGVSLIKVYFQPGTDADTAAASIANLAVADMRDLPPGTLPPIVLKSDASSLPVCLITLNGEGLSDTQLKDVAQNVVRNQLASVPGAAVPQPFGGRWRQLMFYVDPTKLEARQLSPMDVVRAVSEANVVLPAGDVQIGGYDYDIYTNSQISLSDMNQTPLKVVGQSPVRISDVGEAKDAFALQYNIVRVNGQRSVYLPVLKQGGDSNTIQVVAGTQEAIKHLLDTPPTLQSHVVFDQSQFVKTAISTLLHEGGIGLFLTGLMILIFLGSMRATVAVFFSIPLSVLATFIVLQFSGSTVNSMMLGGLALALSRLIDNSVVVLENIYRHLEAGEPPRVAAEQGGREVALPVLSGTLTTAVVFFPVTLLYGVSKFLFSAMALAVVISLAASYLVAMTVVPLFCALLIHSGGQHASAGRLGEESEPRAVSFAEKFNFWFSAQFDRLLSVYDRFIEKALARPGRVVIASLAVFLLSLLLYPFLGFAFFPQTDAGQFVINVKAASGTKLTETEKEIGSVEELVRHVVSSNDLDMIVSNIGLDPGFSAVYSPNAAMHTAFVQVSLKPGHAVSSYDYMERTRRQIREEMPELTAFFSSGSLVDSVVNLGMAAPIDIQISGSNLQDDYQAGQQLAVQIRRLKDASEVYIPQDLDYPALRLDVDRMHASELGLSEKEVVTNVITALTSNQMVAPNIWTDPKNGNNYFLTVQFPEQKVRTIEDLRSIPLHGAGVARPTRLDMVTKITRFDAPTEVDHYQIRRKIDVYVRPTGEDLGHLAGEIDNIVRQTKLPNGANAVVRGSVEAMNASFRSFAVGLILSVGLLYLILVAQFRSFLDPFIILLALPPGITGVMLTLVTTGTTLNVMSLMGLIMLAGIATSNSILIVEFAHRLVEDGLPVRDAIAKACRVRLRPILMTSLATIIGLLPMALKLGEGSESYAPLARALVGGLFFSALVTVFVVPAGFFLAYSRKAPATSQTF